MLSSVNSPRAIVSSSSSDYSRQFSESMFDDGKKRLQLVEWLVCVASTKVAARLSCLSSCAPSPGNSEN